MDIKALSEKMKLLRKLDGKFNLFGANSHKYRLNRRLTENELLDYESQYAVSIPAEYREFLERLGDGGFGPFYGLLQLRDNDKMLQYRGLTDDEGLCKDFPFTRDNPFRLDNDKELAELGEARNKYYEQGMLDEEEKADKAYSECENILYELATQGVKFLCHEGCGMYNVLVMKGAEDGTVWHLDFSGGAEWGCGILPLVNPENNQPLGFFDWYNIWLERSVKSIKVNKRDVWGYAQYSI